MSASVEDRARRYLKTNPNATVPELAGALAIAPDVAESIISDSDVDCAREPGKGDSTPTMSFETHYARVAGIIEELGAIDDTYCVGNRDFYGWYRERDGKGRAWALGNEYDALREDLDRTLYATVNYAPASWYMDSWQTYEYGENGREWHGDTPTPGYGDLSAYAPFADIDLSDTIKEQRPDGTDHRQTVEAALKLYIEAFGRLAGDTSHVYALDSVGGAYVFVAPSSTAPIADAFSPGDRAIIYEELTDRLNNWLADVKEEVNEAVPDAVGVFEPDLVNNKNRLYKAPMSVHTSLDGVVTPIDTDTPQYEYTPFGSVSDADIADARQWAEGFTGDHRDAVGAIVATLWPNYHADAESWQRALEARIADVKAEKKKNKERRTIPREEIPDDIEETDDIDVIRAAIEAIDCRDVARRVATDWDTAPGRDPPRFNPPWRESGSGTSCYADADKYVDLSEAKKGGGALKLVARATGIITHSKQQVRGEDYWRAVNELRKMGYDIPYFTGSKGTHPDGLRLYEDPDDNEDAKRKLLRMLRSEKRDGD